MGAQWLDYFLGPLGHQISIKFRNHPNLLEQIACQTRFLPDQALEFWHRESIDFFFSRRDLRPQLFSFYSFLCKKKGTPFKLQWGAKWRPKSAKWRKTTAPQIEAADNCWRSWKRLVPHRLPNHPKSPQGLILNNIQQIVGPPRSQFP